MPQVTLTNKSEFDQAIGEINERLDAIGAPVDASGLVTLTQATQMDDAVEASAAADATTKATAAQTAAAADATTKANAAQTAAISNTTSQVAAHNTSPSAHADLLADFATIAYVDSVASGTTSYPQACDLATTANHGLSGLSNIDGETPGNGDRILVWQQTDKEDNGVYVAASGAWSRATDFDSDGEIQNGAIIFVSGGDTYGGYQFVLDAPEPQVVGTDPLNFRQYNRPDQAVAESPLVRDGNTFKLPDASITDAKIATANKDGAAGTPSLRTLGTASGQALPGNHASVTNARTPTAHASSHASNGSDAVNPATLGIAGTHVAFSPISGITATNVQNAIAQVQTNVTNLGGGTGTFAEVSTASGVTALPGQLVKVDASAGAIFVTLATAQNNQRPIVVQKVDSSTNAVTIVPASGTINGSPNATITTQWSSRTLISGSTGWNLIGAFDPLSLFARLDQDNDFGGHVITNYRGAIKTVTTSTYTLVAGDAGKTIIFTNPTNATTITVNCPGSLAQPEWSVDLRVLGTVSAVQMAFVGTGGGTLFNADSVSLSAAKRYASVSLSITTNTTGSNAAYALDGYTA